VIVARARVAKIFQKGTDPRVDSYSGFHDNGRRKSTGLGEWLRGEGVTTTYVLGLATDYCVKFTALDAARDGFVMAEAAGLLLLEREDDVVRRGATPYAEIVGYALTNDGQSMVAPREDGREASRAMVLALRDGGIDPSEIDHVSAHGSSTPLNDATESRAIRNALGTAADKIVVSGTKGMTGHALGATGAVEVAMCALGIRDALVVPTINLETPGDGCDLRYSPETPLQLKQRVVMSNSFGFGGLNAAIVVRAA